MKHEEKICPCCQSSFECKVGDVMQCQCQKVILTDEEQKYINQLHNDCLCADCMKDLKREYHFKNLANKIKKLLRL